MNPEVSVAVGVSFRALGISAKVHYSCNVKQRSPLLKYLTLLYLVIRKEVFLIRLQTVVIELEMGNQWPFFTAGRTFSELRVALSRSTLSLPLPRPKISDEFVDLPVRSIGIKVFLQAFPPQENTPLVPPPFNASLRHHDMTTRVASWVWTLSNNQGDLDHSGVISSCEVQRRPVSHLFEAGI